MTNKFRFEELIVYQESTKLVNVVYEITKSWPKDEMFGLTNQLRRAIVSISLNIAEGSSRGKKDFCHFLDIAKGSCFESVTILLIAKEQKYIAETIYMKLYERCYILAKMLSKLKSSLLITNN